MLKRDKESWPSVEVEEVFSAWQTRGSILMTIMLLSSCSQHVQGAGRYSPRHRSSIDECRLGLRTAVGERTISFVEYKAD